MNELNRFLKSPRGLAWLFGLTLVGAIALAIVMATQRSFFEKYAHEKLVAPTGDAQRLADALRRGDIPAASMASRVVPLLDPLYSIYIERPELGDERLAAALVSSAPDQVLKRLERTLVTGSQQQRMRAVKFVETAPHRSFVPMIERAIADARAKRLSDLAGRLEGALSSCRAVGK